MRGKDEGALEGDPEAQARRLSLSSTVRFTGFLDATQLPAVRAMAGDLAMRMDYDLDAVEDLRLAVDEACATLSAIVDEDRRLTVVFETAVLGYLGDERWARARAALGEAGRAGQLALIWTDRPAADVPRQVRNARNRALAEPVR